VPIGAVTNGIHTGSWTSMEMEGLFDRYLGPDWREHPANPASWNTVDLIPDGEIWNTHERRRERLVAFARKRLRQQLESRGAPTSELAYADEALNPDALTIGFARRFATYKRATLLFRDPERLKALLDNPDRPVQLIFSGKAHPHDTAGKDLIRTIVHFASQPDFRHAIVFLENYDMVIARYLVQGCDIWLNTPRRPREASGTSGMKVVYNGGLNASILDGWWAEGYDSTVGWAIGAGEEYSDPNEQDHVESRALYNLLERDIIPSFYDRGRDGLPREWIEKIKNALRTLAPDFNTHRMLREYTEQYYIPSCNHFRNLTTPDLSKGKAFAAWLTKVRDQWPGVMVDHIEAPDSTQVMVGAQIEVKAAVQLGKLTPDDVTVQLYHGPLNTEGAIEAGDVLDMAFTGQTDGKLHIFSTILQYDASGARGMAVRVVPHHPDLANPHLLGLIHWAP
jgi:starch phosphorylase